MDYTSSNSFATDAGTAQRMHLQGQAVPTAVSDNDLNGLTWEALSVIKAAGLAPAEFNKAVPGTYTQLRQAVKRMFGGNVRTITASGPTALTADDAGVVVIDATANAVAITLPAVNVVAGAPLLFKFVRVDATVNTATVSRAGADVFIGGATSFTLTGQADCRTIVGDSVSKWATTALLTVAAAGSVIHVAMSTAPAGYLKANGALISRTAYSALFAAIGTTFGVGDGATTFAVPDLRGEFLRGWDDGRGVDTGRVFGSAQAEAFKQHQHTQTSSAAAGAGFVTQKYAAAAVGSETLDNNSTAMTGGTETRPRNVALLACIKY